MLYELSNALKETVLMVCVSGCLSGLLGLILGILLTITKPSHLFPNSIIHRGLNSFITLANSVPYSILMIALIPAIQLWMRTQDGWTIAIIPLTFAGVPMFTRLCQHSMSTLSKEFIEAMQVMGANAIQIICKVLIPETKFQLVHHLSSTFIHLIGYSVIAGIFTHAGLGNLALQKGYYSFEIEYVLAILILYVALAQLPHFIHRSLQKAL